MSNKVLDILIRAKDEASKVIRGVGKAAADTSKQAGQEEEKTTGNFFSRLAEKAKAARLERRKSGESALQSSLGSGQGITNLIGDALGIGVPLLVADQVGKALANISGKVVEMSAALRQGKANWADLAEGVLESIPVLGGFAKTGANINEFFTHNKENVANEQNEASATDVSTSFAKQRGELMRQSRLEFAHQEFDIKARFSLVGKEGFAADLQRSANAASKTIIDLTEKRDAEIKSLRDKNADSVTALMAKKDAATNDTSKDAIQQQIIDAQKQTTKQVLEIQTRADKDIAAEKDAAAAEQADQLRKHQQVLTKIMDDYDLKTLDSRQSGLQTILKFNHEFFAAELIEAEQANERQKKLLDEQLKERIKGESPEVQQQLTAANDRLKAQMDAQTALNRQAAEKTALQDTSLKLLQMAGEAGNSQAKVQADIISRLREETDLRKKLLTVFNDTRTSTQDRLAAQSQLQLLNNVDRQRVATNLKEVAKQSLEAQAQYGDTYEQRESARRELERQKLLDATKEQAAKVNAILNDPAATQAQKQQALARAKDIAATTARQYQQDIYGNPQAQSVLQAQEAQQTHGLALAAQEADNRENEALSISKEALDVQQQILTTLKNQTTTTLKVTE